MTLITSQVSQALLPDLKQYFQDGFNTFSDWSPIVYNVMNEQGGEFKYDEVLGPGSIPMNNTQNSSTNEIEFTKGYPTDVMPLIFKAKMALSEEMMDWNQYRSAFDRSKAMGEATIQTICRLAAHPFLAGFSSGYTSYGDNKPLFSVSHTNPSGGTAMSNASATSLAATEANLETMMVNMKKTLSATDKKLNIVNNKLVWMVPEALEKEAIIITASTKRSGTGNNDLNYYEGKVSVFVNPWIGAEMTDVYGNAGSDTATYLLAQNLEHLRFNWDMRPTYRMWYDNDKDSDILKVKFRAVPFWTQFLGTYASKGDGTTYAS